MPWPIRIIDRPSSAGQLAALEVGDAWYEDPISPTHRLFLLAPEHSNRRPLTVRLPGPVHFPVFGPETKDGLLQPNGWKVEGEPPALTVTPSIHCAGVYHGYITDGVIADDIEGRTYDARGAVIRTGRHPRSG